VRTTSPRMPRRQVSSCAANSGNVKTPWILTQSCSPSVRGSNDYEITFATRSTLPVGRVDPALPLADRVRLLAEAARAIRRRDPETIKSAGLGHIGGDFSSADILVVLLLAVLKVDPSRPQLADRDRLVMSKGHSSGVLYATLAAGGFSTLHGWTVSWHLYHP